MNACVLWHRDTKKFLDVIVWQPQSSHDTMPKKGKKKSKVTNEDLDLEVMPKTEVIYDTKAIIEAELEFKWGHIYPMIKEQKVSDVGLEDIPLYENILRYGIMKVSTWPKIFLCAKVIS